MPLTKSPRGLIRPYTREGVTSTLKKTAKNAALMTSAAQLLEKQLQVHPVGEEAAEDVVVDVELLSRQVAAAARSAIKDVKKAMDKAGDYLVETVE